MKIDSNLPGPLVSRLRRTFRLNYFVETGTAAGDTTELAAVLFDRVFSCEIDRNLFAMAKERLQGYPNVQLYHLASERFFREIKSQVNQPAMYWLDAHWSGGVKKPRQECPVLEELRAIGSLHGHSVILIDDADYMIRPPPPPHDPKQWPSLVGIEMEVAGWEERIAVKIERGPRTQIITLTPKE